MFRVLVLLSYGLVAGIRAKEPLLKVFSKRFLFSVVSFVLANAVAVAAAGAFTSSR